MGDVATAQVWRNVHAARSASGNMHGTGIATRGKWGRRRVYKKNTPQCLSATAQLIRTHQRPSTPYPGTDKQKTCYPDASRLKFSSPGCAGLIRGSDLLLIQGALKDNCEQLFNN